MNQILFVAGFKISAANRALKAAVDVAKRYLGTSRHVHRDGRIGRVSHGDHQKEFHLRVDGAEENLAFLFAIVEHSTVAKDGNIIVKNNRALTGFSLSVWSGDRDRLVIKVDQRGFYFLHLRREYTRSGSKKAIEKIHRIESNLEAVSLAT